jgi:predicted aspartyl protease
MGHVYTDIEITGQRGKKRLRNILIDTGATYTVVEPSVIKIVNAIRAPGKVKLELGDGKRVNAQPYAVRVKIGLRQGPAIVITSPSAKNVMGVETLENLGLSVNLKKKRLEGTRPPRLAYFYTFV